MSKAWGFFKKREVTVPTWRGWVLILLLAIALLWIVVRGSYSFLAVNNPSPAEVLVVEGWAPDYGLAAAMEEFNRKHYQKLFVTGVPIESGAPLSEYKTYAELGAAVLVKLGLSTNVVQPVPAPWVRQDRTYTCAVVLRDWFHTNGIPVSKANLMTEGPHARRSRLLFQKAFGKQTEIGIISIAPHEYDPKRWWRSSAGFRVVTSEGIAYFYARFLFHAAEPK